MAALLLEIQLHLVNGNTHRFVQDKPEPARQILQQITPKVFEQHSLVIAGENSVVTYPGTALSGIGLLMDELLEEVLHLPLPSRANMTTLSEIAPDDYQAIRQQVWPIEEGRPFVMVHEVEFLSARRLWLEAHVQSAVSGIQERQIVHSIFSGPALVCNRLGGGISLWNRAHMVSYSFHPAPGAPAPYWPAERED